MNLDDFTQKTARELMNDYFREMLEGGAWEDTDAAILPPDDPTQTDEITRPVPVSPPAPPDWYTDEDHAKRQTDTSEHEVVTADDDDPNAAGEDEQPAPGEGDDDTVDYCDAVGVA